MKNPRYASAKTVNAQFSYKPRVNMVCNITMTSDVQSIAIPDYSYYSGAFRISATTTWNSLPQNVRGCSSLVSFRNHPKTHYFISASSAL